ncbi:MAG: glycosyltransferase family 4 protein [Chloroflexota bacterium]
MNILFVAHFYPPEMGGASARLHGLARLLVQRGHHVTVITGFPNYPSGEIREEYQGRWYCEEELDGVQVIRTWIYATPRKGSIRRLANYFSFVLSSVISGGRQQASFDVIFASSPPLFIGLSGLALSWWWKRPWVFDIRDIWPELAVEAGEFDPDALIVRWGNRLERFLYRRADHITVVTERKRQKLRQKEVPEEKLSIVANGVDLDRIGSSTSEYKDWRSALDLDGKFVALYAGLMGIFQRVEVIVEAAIHLRERSDIHFVLAGDGVRRDVVEKTIADEHLQNVTLLPSQPGEQIPAMLKAFDLALVPLINENLVDAVPSKLLEAWGCRRPVLLIAGGEARQLVETSNGGFVVSPGCTEALVQTIVDVVSMDGEARQRYANNGYEYVLAHYDRAKLAEQLEAVLQRQISCEFSKEKVSVGISRS